MENMNVESKRALLIAGGRVRLSRMVDELLSVLETLMQELEATGMDTDEVAETCLNDILLKTMSVKLRELDDQE